MQSILQSEKYCWVCGTTYNLHKHHIYGGGNRKTSDQNGFWVWLCAKHHNMSNAGVHFNKELDNTLKMVCQQEFERTHTRKEFMDRIGKNYR